MELRAWFVGCGLFAIGAFAGCTPPARGAISADGFRHSDYSYRVLPLGDGRLMPERWTLDNFYEAAGVGETKGLKAKDGERYVIEYTFDTDGDGEFETKVEELIYDLRFKHLKHDGVIFLRTIPISTDLGEKKLSVLMDRHVEAIAGAGYEVVSLNSSVQMVVEKRYAPVRVAKGAAKLAGREAFVTILDVANIDQVKVDPNARMERVELVLLHTDFTYKHEPLTTGAEPVTFPVLLLAGYANSPDEFAEGRPDFHELLARIELDGQRGFEPAELAELDAKSEAPGDVGAETEPAEPVDSAPEPAKEPAEKPGDSAPERAPDQQEHAPVP